MKTKGRLTSEEQEFFSMLNSAVTMNPFDEKRSNVLAPTLSPGPGSRKDRKFMLEDAFPVLCEKLDAFDRNGFSRIQDFSKENRL